MRTGFGEDGLNVVGVAVLKLALEVSTTVLIGAKLDEVATVGFKRDIVVSSLIELVATTTAATTGRLWCSLAVASKGVVQSKSTLRLATVGLKSSVLTIDVVCWKIEAKGLCRVEASHTSIGSVAGTEWCSTCLKRRLTGACGIVIDLVQRTVGEISALTVVDAVVWNAAKSDVVVMELLIGLVVVGGCDVLQGQTLLDSGNIVGRV